MVHVVSLSDMVEPNGKTVRENNLERKHNIALYAKVQITTGINKGITLFVQGHSRDCDGTPLYCLTHDWRVIGKDVSSDALHKKLVGVLDNMTRSITQYSHAVASGSVYNGVPEECLIVVESAEDVLASISADGWVRNAEGEWH